MLLRRHDRLEQHVDRLFRRAVEVDAAAAHFLPCGFDRVVARERPRGPGHHVGVAVAAAAAALRLQPRHLQYLQRLHYALEVDAGGLFQLAHITVGKRLELDAELAQLPLSAGSATPREAVGARRVRRTLPAAV